MTFDYGSECNPHLLSCVQLRSGQVKLFNLLLKLDQWENADAIPLNRPKQHVDQGSNTKHLHQAWNPHTRNLLQEQKKPAPSDGRGKQIRKGCPKTEAANVERRE